MLFVLTHLICSAKALLTMLVNAASSLEFAINASCSSPCTFATVLIDWAAYALTSAMQGVLVAVDVIVAVGMVTDMVLVVVTVDVVVACEAVVPMVVMVVADVVDVVDGGDVDLSLVAVMVEVTVVVIVVVMLVVVVVT